MDDFAEQDYWRCIILYGLNAATYKMALAQVLLRFSSEGATSVPWTALAEAFLDAYQHRLRRSDALPQQGTRGRRTVLERAFRELTSNRISRDEAINLVATEGLTDVVPRFQSIGRDQDLIGGRFYDFSFGEKLTLKDPLFLAAAGRLDELQQEIEARWSLLEGAFAISQENWALANDLRETYLRAGHKRRSLTGNIPFLEGYQGNVCFYCGVQMVEGDVHVDHVLPRQALQHDEAWNLVLAHGLCNMRKSDRLVGAHHLEKLRQRNENIVGSSHPWRRKIIDVLGATPMERWQKLRGHHDAVAAMLGKNYWDGDADYSPERDSFFKKLITKLNNPAT
jgi:hypothetical protein